MAEIRKALEDGDRQKAKQLAEQNLVGPNNAQYGRYLAFGDIFMVFNNQKKGLDTVTDYHRNLETSPKPLRPLLTLKMGQPSNARNFLQLS